MAISNRYPTARHQVARDYRRDRPERRYRPRYPTPDNDNKPGWKPRKPVPLIPANDNRPVPKVSDWSYSRPPRLPGYKRWLRLFLRLNPLIGAALTLWELYDLYRWYQEYLERGLHPEGSNRLTCANDNPAWSRRMSFWYGSGDLLICESFWYPPGAPEPGQSNTWSPFSQWWVEWENRPEVDPNNWWWMRATRFPTDPGGNPTWIPEDGFYPKPWTPPFLEPDIRPPPWDEPFVEPNRPLPPTPPRPRYKPDKRLPEKPLLPEDTFRDEPTFRPQPDGRDHPLPRRPRKRERERKVRLRDMPNKRLRRIMGWLLSAASEGGDFLDIMYGALPKKLQNEDADMSEKFQTVFTNLDKVDFDKFVSDLWQNEVNDRYFGKGFKDMSDALEAFGLELPTLKI